MTKLPSSSSRIPDKSILLRKDNTPFTQTNPSQANQSRPPMAGASPPSLVDSLFQRSVDDLIRSLRSNPAAEPALISRSLDEIRREIRSTDLATKSSALQKLTYLFSLHHIDMSWAAFHSLELLPSSIHHKRLAYLAASLSFHPSTDVLLLITNQLRKDLSSSFDPVSGLALEFIAVAATPDLARDLTSDVHTLLASTRTPVRKKATAAILRVFSQCPDSVRIAFKRLVDNLECQDQRIVSAAVGVLCELSASDPRAYLPLAPEFYRILVDGKNNWVLIKVLKIFARLTPLEPRLAKRVVEPICEHMRRSMAKSLVFECIRTVLLSLYDYEHAVRLAIEKTKEFLVSEDDPNLRYLGLRALSMLKPINSWAVEENREVVVKSLGDPDPNIQREALHLVMGLVTDSNAIEISNLLAKQAMKSDPLFCNEILGAILNTCSRNFYELIVDFDWYVSLLGEMSRNPHCAKGEEIERQLVDIAMRVKDARLELVHVSRDLLIDPALLGNPFLYRILSAAAWISGEYIEFSSNPFELVEALLQPRTSLLPTLVRAVYIQAMFKVLVFCHGSYIEQIEAGQQNDLVAEGQVPEISVQLETSSNNGLDENSGTENKNVNTTGHQTESLLDFPETSDPFTYESISQMVNLIKVALSPLLACDEVEVQERARNVLGLVHILQENQACDLENGRSGDVTRMSRIVKLMQDAMSEELGPVPANAQTRIPVPPDLVLLENLDDIATVLGDEYVELPSVSTFALRGHHHVETKEESELPAESTSLLDEHRKRHGLYYLTAQRESTESSDYPRANDLQGNSAGGAAEDLVKLTQKSLDSKNTKPAKPRPVVIKLDGEDDTPSSYLKLVKESKDDSLSGVVRNVLLGNEDEPTSSKKKFSDKSSRRRVKNMPLERESTSPSKENLGDLDHESSRSRHHSKSKDKHKSSQENEDKDKVEEKSHRSSRRSSHHHGQHKQRQRGNKPLDVVLQTPVIQDFLL